LPHIGDGLSSPRVGDSDAIGIGTDGEGPAALELITHGSTAHLDRIVGSVGHRCDHCIEVGPQPETEYIQWRIELVSTGSLWGPDYRPM
jgi:hypothetical protein